MSGAFDKIDPLPKTILKKRQTAKNILDAYDCDIEARIGYVLNVLYSAFGTQLDCWWFQDSGGENLIDFMEWNDKEVYTIEANSVQDVLSPALILDGELWEFYGGLPLRWLFNDCEKEIIDGRMKWEKKYGQSVQDQQKMIDKKKKDALAKLTKEERKLLNIG